MPRGTSPSCTADTSPQTRITSPEGWILVFSPPHVFMLKIQAKKYFLKYFLQYEFMFPQNPKDKKPAEDLFGSARIYAETQEVN